MGSTRDSAPDPRRTGSPVRPPLSAHLRLHPVSPIAPLAASTPGRTPPESCHDLTTGRGCHADSVYNAERIAQVSITAWESWANCSSRPWVLMRTLCQRSVSGNYIAVIRTRGHLRGATVLKGTLNALLSGDS